MSDYYGPPASVQNSSMAVVSLIAGILGLTLFPVLGSIVAVITGPMAKKEIAASPGTVGGEGLAQAGIIMGWIGIGLTVVGLCVGGVLIAIPFCIAIGSGEFSSLVPLVFGLI